MNATVMKGSMETFRYRAATISGQDVRGTVTARTASDALTQVSALGLFPISVERSSSRRQSYVAPGDIALASRLFADLLDAGLPVSRALECLEQAAPAAFRRRIPVIAGRLRSGASVSQALDAPGGIPPLLVQFARAGEAGSGLANALRTSAEYFDFVAKARTSIAAALAYPAFLLVACSITLAVLVGSVLPRLSELLAGSGADLPPSARVLLAVSAVVQAAFPALAAVAAGAFACAVAATRHDEAMVRFHRLLDRTPVIGDIRRSMSSATACWTIGALASGGATLPVALELGGDTCGDAWMRERMHHARGDVLGGRSLASALARAGALTPLCIQLVRTAEQTGDLPAMLIRAGRLEQERALGLLRRATGMLGPVLVLGFGAVIAWAAIALLQAVYGVRAVP